VGKKRPEDVPLGVDDLFLGLVSIFLFVFLINYWEKNRYRSSGKVVTEMIHNNSPDFLPKVEDKEE